MIRSTIIASLLLASNAFAAGELNYSVQNQSWFWGLNAYEDQGRVEGQMGGFGGTSYFSAEQVGDDLQLEFMGIKSSLLVNKDVSSGRKTYRGFLWMNILVDLQYIPPNNKGVWRLFGKLGQYTDVHVDVDTIKKRFDMYWTMKDRDGNRFYTSLNFKDDPSNGPGACRGDMGEDGQLQRAKFFCNSGGKLENAFFWSPEHVIALIVRPMIYPDDSDPLP